MAQNYIDSAKAEEEADRIARIARQNLQEVLKSFKDCLQVVYNTRRMLKLDPECICVNSEAKWERRTELYEAAESIRVAMEVTLRSVRFGVEASLEDTPASDDLPEDEVGKLGRNHSKKPTVENDDLLWCDRVCVYKKINMDSSLWCNLPHPILELVFARLPLHQIFQLRVLSKYWRSSITSATFQNAFGSTASRRFAIIAGRERKRLRTFGTLERRWYTIPFDFLPMHYDVPIAGDGGLLCCQRPAFFPIRGNQVKVQDLQLYVCNPLAQTWRKIPLPSHVQAFKLVHLVTNRQTKQYTITVVDNSHNLNAKAKVEVYDSTTNTWKTGGGIFKTSGATGNNLIYFKDYLAGEFLGIRAYDKNTGLTSKPISIPGDILFSEAKGFFPLTEYQGQIYLLRTEMDVSGIWVLQGPKHKWEKICSVPEPEILNCYIFSLFVSEDVIVIFGERRLFHDNMYFDDDESVVGPGNPYMWMLDRSQGMWLDIFDMVDHEWDLISVSEIMFEMRVDGIP